MIETDFGAPGIAELLADFDQLFPDDLRQTLRARQDVRQVADDDQQFLVLGDDLVLLQPREAMQAHLEDGLRLGLAQAVTAGLQAELGCQPIRA